MPVKTTVAKGKPVQEKPERSAEEMLSRLEELAEEHSSKEITSYLNGSFSSEEEKTEKLGEILELAESLEEKVRYQLFFAITSTKQVDRIISPEMREFLQKAAPEVAKHYLVSLRIGKDFERLDSDDVRSFALSLDPEVASYYFSWMGEFDTAVARATAPRVLGSSGFFNSVGPDAAKAYISAVYRGKAELLFDPRVMERVEFLKALKPLEAYFEALSEDSVDVLTSDKFVSLSSELNSMDDQVVKNYLQALGVTKNIEVMASEEFLKELELFGDQASSQFLYAVWRTGKLEELLQPEITGFAEQLDPIVAGKYFYVIGAKGIEEEGGKEFFDTLAGERLRSFVLLLEPVVGAKYLSSLTAKGAFDLLVSDEGMQLVESLGGVASQFLEIVDNSLKFEPGSLKFILGVYASSPEEFERVIDRAPELLLYHTKLLKSEYDASEETRFLIKKGNKAEITRLAVNVGSGIALAEHYHPELLEYLQKSKEFLPVAERIKAIDRVSVFLRLEGDLPEELKAEKAKDFKRILGEGRKPTEEDEQELREKFPEVMGYVDRHKAHADSTPGYESPISEEEVLEMLLVARDCGRELNLNVVKKEKQQLASGREVAFKPKFEEKFVSELRSSVRMARQNALLEALDAHRAILSVICGRKIAQEEEISENLGNVLEGFFGIKYNQRVLADLVRIYHEEGPEAAIEWISGLEGNKRVVKKMEERGTNVKAMHEFKLVLELSASQSFQEKQELRAAMIFSELKSLVRQLGYSGLEELGVEETGDREADSIEVAKKLNERARQGGFSPEQKIIVDDVNEHLAHLKTSVGQLHSIEEGKKVVFFVPRDPIEEAQMGVGFPSCLDIKKGSNRHGAVARTVDENNPNIFAAEGDENGQVISRVSLLESDKGFLVNSQFYENTTLDLFNEGESWVDVLLEFSRQTGREVMIVPTLFASHPKIVELLKAYGFELEEVGVHIDKAVCDVIYSDLGFEEDFGEEGLDVTFEAYVLKA